MKRLVSGAMALCLLIIGLLTGCRDDGTGKGFRLPLDSDPAQLDPQFSMDASSTVLITALFEGLTRLDKDGNPIPGAAEWTVSPDQLTYTFTLKESYWSTLSIRGEETPWDDPVRVVADDFVFGFQRAVSPQANLDSARILFGIAGARDVYEGKKKPEELGVKAINDSTLTITLNAPDKQFPARLAGLPCMPCNREFFAYTGGRYGLEKQYLISNGPFWLAAWNHDESLLMYKNEHYHGQADVAPEAVRYVIGGEQSASAVADGDLDVTYLPPEQLPAARQAGVQVVALEDTVRSLWFNTAAVPLSNPSIRQALRDSIQWDAVYGYLEDAGEKPAAGFVPPAAVVTGSEIYRREDNRRPFVTDVKRAQQALTNGLRQIYPQDPSPKLPPLTVVAADDEVSANIARYILQSWQKNLKIYATMTTLPAHELEARMRQGQLNGAQAVIYTCTPSGLTGAENLSSFATAADGNLSGYTDQQTDRAIQAALLGGRSELDALENRLWDQCPVLPLSFPKRYYGLSPQIKDVIVRPFGGGVFGAPLDFLQAKKRK